MKPSSPWSCHDQRDQNPSVTWPTYPSFPHLGLSLALLDHVPIADLKIVSSLLSKTERTETCLNERVGSGAFLGEIHIVVHGSYLPPPL